MNYRHNNRNVLMLFALLAYTTLSSARAEQHQHIDPWEAMWEDMQKSVEEMRLAMSELASSLAHGAQRGIHSATTIASELIDGSLKTKATDDAYYVEVALPGFKKEDIKATIQKWPNKPATLTVVAETSQKEETKNNDVETQSTTRLFGIKRYKQVVTLPFNAKTDAYEASYENGIFMMKFPLEKTAQDLTEVTIK